MEIRVRVTRIRVAAVAFALGLAVAGGVAYATIPDAGVFTACTSNATGAVRLIDPTGTSNSPLSHCRASEAQVSWSQTGPQGLPGLKGDKGDTGDKGDKGDTGSAPTLSTYTIQGPTTFIGSFYDDGTSGWNCPYGDFVTGGGFVTNNVDVKKSGPNGNNGWYAYATGGLEGGSVRVYVQCLHVSP